MIGSMLKQFWFSKLALFLCVCFAEGDVKHKQTTEKNLTSLQLPPCEACTMVYESFMDAMKLTAQNHFGGGDTSWEEAKLGPYATSEVRLIEIQELLCSKKRAQDQCHTLVEEWEQHIEDWWFKHRSKTPDLHNYLCMNSLKLCCPSGHFGPECQTCPGSDNKICNDNGKCEGDGTRGGSGKCICDEGYEGKLCENCAIDFFSEVVDDKFSCTKCDISCLGGCTSSGSKNCKNCAKGWIMDKENGCLDLDECTVNDRSISNLCKENEFCINTPGSYKCKKCDKSCDGCSGSGSDNCLNCASGFILIGSSCVADDSLKSYSNFTRYLIYLGLCLATFILFKSRPLLASFVGLAFALYITMTEYMHGNVILQKMFLSVTNFIKKL